MPESGPENSPQNYATAVMQAIREPLLVLDANLHVKAAIPSFYNRFRATPEQTLGRPLHELGNEQWNSPTLTKLLDGLLGSSGDFDDYQVEHDFPDIGRRTMLLNARRLHNGDKTAKLILLGIEDVTERRAATHKLQESEVRYRRLFEAAHDGILILNTVTRRISDVNPFMLELLDYPREHFIGKELWEIGIFRDKEANQSAMLDLQKNGSVRFEDLPLQDRNGHRHPVEIVANVYQEDEQPVIQCNIRDIGERVQFERQRETLLANEQASRLEAESANRSKDLFLATLSHEVRTPLNAILGWATILRSGKCNDADFHEGMEVIERNCQAQSQLIEDVLDVSRIVSGKMQLQIGRCELVQIINAAIEVISPLADAKHIHFETDLDPAASRAMCDPHRMRQVIWNLLANAVKFSAKGKVVRIALSRELSTARIQVIDEGQGISPDFMPHVFDRFRQAESSTQRKLGGLGLGLSIVKHIVELHGGTVHAASAGEGRGAIFTVNLPVRAVQTEEADINVTSGFQDAVALESVRLDGLRVLVVDDENDVRRILAKVLGETGAIVTAVGSVAEAAGTAGDHLSPGAPERHRDAGSGRIRPHSAGASRGAFRQRASGGGIDRVRPQGRSVAIASGWFPGTCVQAHRSA